MADPEKKEDNKKSTPPWKISLVYVLLAVVMLILWNGVSEGTGAKNISYSEFRKHVARGEVVECAISYDSITGKIDLRKNQSAARKNGLVVSDGTNFLTTNQTLQVQQDLSGKSVEEKENKVFFSWFRGNDSNSAEESFSFITTRVDNDSKLVEDLVASGAEFVGKRPSFFEQFIIAWVLPFAIIIGLWIFISRKMGMGGQSILSIGKSKARVAGDKNTGVTFADVAGCDEAKYELQEVVDFLKNPSRYKALGAQIPKGVLLIGPPGTGKTLLARAVAGEAKVVFFSLSGSDFVEMFVGVGAARVRDLFQQAKAQAPSIIFIDELDAIGRQRGIHMGAVNDEREQTLNQLLVELDGFEPNTSVIVLGATNRPDVLDKALLRPGRFDRQVLVDAPDLEGRVAILNVHSRSKPLGADTDLRVIAQGTPGFSGADLANVLNEAALLAARRLSSVIMQSDLEEAVEKVIAGTERRSRRLRAKELQRVAIHEAGHAMIAAYDKDCDPVQKISIVTRGRSALGYTMQVPPEDQFILTRSELMARISGLLGGRAAEEISFKEVSTGAENDLKRATSLARQMVCMYGMSKTVGLTHCLENDRGMFLGNETGYHTDCSQETNRLIDKEVLSLLNKAYKHAKEILTEHREQLKLVTDELLKKETIDAHQFYALLNMDIPEVAPPPKKEEKEEMPPPLPLFEDAGIEDSSETEETNIKK